MVTGANSTEQLSSAKSLHKSGPMKLRILSENDVRSVLSMADAIDIQADAFAALAEGRSVEGLRSFAKSETPPGVAIFNPAFLNVQYEDTASSAPTL